MIAEVNIVAYNEVKMVNDLINNFRRDVPSWFIRVWDNSPSKLDIIGANEVRWNRFNPSLSRVWNWSIAQSQTDWVLIANDDLQLIPVWYDSIFKEMEQNPDVLWHGPSRFFLFNKKLISKVGWFDEGLVGLCYEDLDYCRRMNFKDVPICYGMQCCLHNEINDLKSYTNRIPHNAGNEQYFYRKYADRNRESFLCEPLFETPDFYPNRPEIIKCA